MASISGGLAVGMDTSHSSAVAQQSCGQGVILQKGRKSIPTDMHEGCSQWTVYNRKLLQGPACPSPRDLVSELTDVLMVKGS